MRTILCPGCGRERDHEAHGKCSSCNRNDWDRAHPERKAATQARYRAKRRKKGICFDCTEKAFEGKRHCEKHLKAYCKREQRRKVSRRAERGMYQGLDFDILVRRGLE